MKKLIILAVFTFLSISTIAYAATITSHLEVGSTGQDVTTLQTYLIQRGLLTTATGQATGYFGTATQAAVETLQSKNGVAPTGMVGPATRAVVNNLIAGDQTVTSSQNSGNTTASVTPQIASNNVTFSNLADGEVHATFTYNGKTYAMQGYTPSIYTGTVAELQSNGSFSSRTGSTPLALLSLESQIFSNSPKNQTIFPGFTFSTPLFYVDDVSPYYVDTPPGAFSITKSPYANIPPNLYYLNIDSSDTLTGVTPIDLSLTGTFTTGTEIPVAANTVSPSLNTALDTIMQATDAQDALNIATQAGLSVNVAPSDSDDPSQTLVEIHNPNTNKILAVIRSDDLQATATGNTPDESSVCSAGNGNSASNLFVNSDGKIYGINGNYNLSFNCAAGSDQTMCAMAQTETGTVLGDYNAAGGPQGTMEGNPNGQSVNVTLYPSISAAPGNPTQGLVAGEAFTVAIDGGPSYVNETNAVCNVNIYGGAAKMMTILQTATRNYSPQQLQNFLGAAIEHEMGHCFGFSHDDNSSIMHAGGSSSFVQTGPIPIGNDSTNMSSVLQEIGNGSVPVTSCSSFAQSVGCKSGQVFDLSTFSCVDSLTGITTEQTSNSDENSTSCYCTSTGAICDQNGTPINAPSSFCSANIVPTGVVCECFNGQSECANTNGDEVPVPADFSCKTIAESQDTYSCNSNNECVIDPSGSYTSSTCDDACGGEESELKTANNNNTNTTTTNIQYAWTQTPWSPSVCPSSGVQTRTVSCFGTNGSTSSTGCNPSTEPATTQTCTAPVVTTVVAPVITGVQGYPGYTNGTAVAGQTLVLYGTFASSGNTVKVGGQLYTPTYQSTSQLNVPLGSVTGSLSITVANTNGISNTQSVTVTAPASVTTLPSMCVGTAPACISSANSCGMTNSGTQICTNGSWGGCSVTAPADSSCTVNPPPVSLPPTSTTQITGIQGYPGYTNGTAVAGQYLVIYGTFTASGNTVTVGGQSATITYQSTSQINVSLGSAVGQMTVTVSNANGSDSSSVTVTAQTSMVSLTSQLANVLSAVQTLWNQYGLIFKR